MPSAPTFSGIDIDLERRHVGQIVEADLRQLRIGVRGGEQLVARLT
jgi:hypothetical protein